MHKLNPDKIRTIYAHQSSGTKYAAAFSLNCPHCSELAAFSTNKQQAVYSAAGAIVAPAECPACLNKITLVTMTEDADGHLAFVYPAPRTRKPISEEQISEHAALDRAYRSAVQAFNVGLWDSCLTSCRRTLEGIVKIEGSSSARNLFQQLRDFFSGRDLSEPLVHLTDTIREGGNIGAHFSQDREPDSDAARMTLDLIEYFLEYIYIMPQQSQALERQSLGNADAEPAADDDPPAETTG